jgi:predicted alpha/beta-fold hydrolase
LNEIRLPTLLVNSLDDPFLAKECYPFATAENSTFFHLETPKNGGHVGFVSFNNGGTYYSERRAIEFLNSF